ncbi:hypothetical protein BV20DRAFT_1117718 [Pilatotrama ljubarskyi]|nr:hypothetical protein BV20DRAFT_1117718 [Pilatotrama ljubarskyi]
MSAAASPAAVSSSSTLWATASKEWVIPAKPKPGRKPKKDVAPPPEDGAETDSKGRRVQNRAAQRAFRERKQSQLAELQARLQQYEQGEIERNVALQNIAKRLKEENEKLRKENAELKERVAQFEERAAQKRSRDEFSSQLPYDVAQSPAKKRNKVSIDSLNNFTQGSFPPMSYASSPSAVSSADSSDAHSSFSPVPMPQSARDTPIFPQTFGLNGIFELAATGKTSLFEPGGALDAFDCGLCNENTPCFCREMALQQVNERMSTVNTVSPMKLETADQNAAAAASSPSAAQQTSTSILDNLPAYQAPVPLRRRAPNPSLQPVFPVSLPSAEPSKPEAPSCTGDPSNCAACADDAFGKAFCAAISKSVSSSTPCKDCPGRGEGGCCSSTSGAGCCGNPAACGRGGSDGGGSNNMAASGSGIGASTTAAATAAPLTASLLMSEPLTTSETIPCDAAWRQIKSHPNAAFTDLSLLADVVARRTKCTGPRVEISPAPGSITPERGLSPGVGFPSYTQQQDSQPILLTDPHAQYHERQRTRANGTSSPPQLVPQEVLVKCGRQRVREVMADGVRDALRLLDARFAVP